MAEILIRRADLDRVDAALKSVASNGQASAAAEASLASADRLVAILLAEGGQAREAAAKSIGQARARVVTVARALSGDSAATLPAGTAWKLGRDDVRRLWMEILLVEEGLPPGADAGDGWASAVADAVGDLPTTIAKAIRAAGGVAKEAIAQSTGIVGAGVAGVLKAAWPILAIGAVAVGVVVWFAHSHSAEIVGLVK
jgi:hypothetical protein